MDAALLIIHALSQTLRRWICPATTYRVINKDFDFSEGFSCQDWDVNQWVDFAREYRVKLNLVFQRALKRHTPIDSQTFAQCARYLYQHLVACKDNGAKNLFYFDDCYPPLLRHIQDPPLCLTVLGDESSLKKTMVTVVGSRKASFHSLAQSFELGQKLSVMGYTIVSGGAYGCDIACHKGAVSDEAFESSAVVVFAGGLGQLYPRGNLAVFRKILTLKGALLSERLWMAPSKPCDFPVRNRIVSGLSRETFVVEANKRSGALITARMALEQGREVSILDQPFDYPGGQGNKWLESQGAKAFDDAQQWLNERFKCRTDVVVKK